jgi:hypothetical protein
MTEGHVDLIDGTSKFVVLAQHVLSPQLLLVSPMPVSMAA